MRALRIGTRGSPLALWQARAVKVAIEATGGPACELLIIKTSGDRLASASVSEVGGKRLFVKEIEEVLLNGSVDLAVHSAKDLPADVPPGLTIGATLPREDPHDVLALPARHDASDTLAPIELFAAIGPSTRVGTSSVRRIAQLSSAFRGATFEPIRGNVETRLRKLDEGGYDVIVLAAAGLIRLGLAHRIAVPLSYDECMPAPGQGIVAIENLASDTATAEVLKLVSDRRAMVALEAERALVTALGGGCQVPIGAIATEDEDGLTLQVIVASLDGTRVLRRQGRGPVDTAARLGQQVASELIDGGASEILAQHS